MVSSKFLFLKTRLMDKLGEDFILKEEVMNNNKSIDLILDKKKGMVQILVKNIEPLGKGETRFTYRVNLFISNNLQDPNQVANDIYLFLKEELQGVNAKDIFYNLTNNNFNQFSFNLIILEGV